MVGTLAAGFGTIMAIDAIGGRCEATVIGLIGGQPGRRLMTSITGSLGHDVARILAGGQTAVVTGSTSSAGHASMVKFRADKRLRAVTSFAAYLGRQMRWWLDNIVFGQTQAAGMTVGTVFWCTLEYTVDVA